MFWRAIGILFFGLPAAALTGEIPRSADVGSAVLSAELAKRFPGARIELASPIRWVGTPPAAPVSAAILAMNPRGEVQFTARDVASGASEAWVSFRAWVPAQVANRRILPGERLSAESFTVQEVNVATGLGHEYRGVILPPAVGLSGLESRQTILEGQFLISSAVQKVPDVRKGDLVRIQIRSGALNVSTLGTAEEPGYLNARIRVMASKTKREFVGQLVSGGIVEVQL